MKKPHVTYLSHSDLRIKPLNTENTHYESVFL